MLDEKKRFRSEFKAIRRVYAEAERRGLSLMIARNATALPEYGSAWRVMLFDGLADEADTTFLLDEIIESGREAYLPRMIGPNEMEAALYDGETGSRESEYGFREPIGKRVARLSEIDLIFAPGLAFDMKGNRMGRGLGCYDKFLAGFSGSIGALAYESQIVSAIPADDRDVPMDFIVTESRVIRRAAHCRRWGDEGDG